MRPVCGTRRDIRREAGQSSVEYVGLTTVVLVLLLAVSHVDVGERLVASLGGEICSAVLAAPCSGSAADVAAARLAALEPCPMRTVGAEESINATVFSLRGAGSEHAVVEQRSDGTVTATFRDRAEVGAEVGAGASVSFKGAGGLRGGGLRAEAGAGVTVDTGKTWRFRDARAATAFVARYAAAETIGGEAFNRVAPGCPACRAAGARPAVPPSPDATSVEAGGSAHASADASAGPAGAGVDALAEAAIGRRVDRRSGQETLYWRIAGDGSGSVDALLGVVRAEASAAAGAETVLALTRARDGTPLSLTVESTRRHSDGLEGSLALPGSLASEMPDAAGSISGDASRARVLQTEAVLDLRADVLSREAALRFVRALEHVSDPAELLASAEALRARVDAAAEQNVRVFDQRRGSAGFEAAGAAGVKIGGGFERVGSVRTLTAAYTRAAGDDAFVDRSDCLGIPADGGEAAR